MSLAPLIDEITYPFPQYPGAGEVIEVADGIFWVSTPVPFVGLKQVNLWLIRDGDGWTQIDCGYGRADVREQLTGIWADVLGGRPVTRLIVTHVHPDHAGNAAWIGDRWTLRPLMTQAEWFVGNLSLKASVGDGLEFRSGFYRAHGAAAAEVDKFLAEHVPYRDGVSLPGAYTRLRDGDDVAIGADRWRVITGEGHSPEHMSLYCAERKILIAGDQILPGITTNVSTWAGEPEFDAVGAYLASGRRFYDLLDPDTLVLPSHRRPFRNVRQRLRELDRHHAARLNRILDSVTGETTAAALLGVLFRTGLDGHQLGFAMGEAIAHLNHLTQLGLMTRIEDQSGIRYRRRGDGRVGHGLP